jgi:hypothetical protein
MTDRLMMPTGFGDRMSVYFATAASSVGDDVFVY